MLLVRLHATVVPSLVVLSVMLLVLSMVLRVVLIHVVLYVRWWYGVGCVVVVGGVPYAGVDVLCC